MNLRQILREGPEVRKLMTALSQFARTIADRPPQRAAGMSSQAGLLAWDVEETGFRV